MTFSQEGSYHEYIVESALGNGSFGQVLKCRRTDTYKAYAVKVINMKAEKQKYALAELKILDKVCAHFFPCLLIFPKTKSHLATQLLAYFRIVD